MKHKSLSILVLTLILICSFYLPRCTLKPQKFSGKFNVLIIVADALRKDILGCYGGPARTPHINWLAENGVLFEKAYSTAPSTMPSSVSMLTGNYSRCYGVIPNENLTPKQYKYFFYIMDAEFLLGEYLSQNGYTVRMEIENALAARSNNLQGFQRFLPPWRLKPKEKRFVEKNTQIQNRNWHKLHFLSSNYDRMYSLLHTLLTLQKEERFFFLKWIYDPHSLYNPPDEFRKRIKYDTSRLSHKEDFYSISQLNVLRESIPKSEYGYIKKLYQAEVESVDERVGFILESLRQKGLMDNTFIVFTSDHGEAFGEHDRLGHGYSYMEPLVNVPLIIYGPGLSKGTQVDTYVSLLSLIPTIKDLMGVSYRDNTQGKSFASFLYGKRAKDRILYFDNITNSFDSRKLNSDALIMNGYKLTCSNTGDKETVQLFNLADDPGEVKNITKENPQIVQRMYARMLRIRKENHFRLRNNLAALKEDIDPELDSQKTSELLRSLGYIK